MNEKVKKKRGNGKPFVKGDKRAGRPKGVPNKVTKEAREAAEAIVDDPLYRSALYNRAVVGRLAPAVETMLWHYAKGKPKEVVQLQNPDGSPVVREVVVRFLNPGEVPSTSAVQQEIKQLEAQEQHRAGEKPEDE